MNVTETAGIVRALEAHTIGYGASKRVVGTMVTVRTRVLDDEGNDDVDTKVFLLPNSKLPTMGSDVVVVIGSKEDVELESLSTEQSLALGVTREDNDD